MTTPHDRLLTGWQDADGALHVVLPIPPGVLGHHGDGWVRQGVTAAGRRYRVTQATTAFREHKQLAVRCWQQATGCDRWYWPQAVMDVRWYFAGVQPDPDGASTRLSAARDAAQAAGVMANDQGIVTTPIVFVRVPRRYQCVEVTLRREDH